MPIDLNKLERLEREATPGPWEWNGIAIEAGRTDVLAPGESDSFGYGTIHIAEEDKNLIVALRNAAPALIAELRAARERIVEMRRVLGIAQDALDRMMGDSDLDGDNSLEMRAMKAIASTLEESPNAD